MVKLDKIYTRGGDQGQTSLGDGGRRRKDDPRIASIGDIDELNSVIGVAIALAGPGMGEMLAHVQNDLFDLGADLAAPPRDGDERLRVVDAQVAWLEARIDSLNGALGPLTSFILPGGSMASAQLHVARTVCRRVERSIVATVEAGDPVGLTAMRYVNRLSDLLFVAARSANAEARVPDVLWRPGANRD